MDITPPAARYVTMRRGLKGFRDSRQLDGVAMSQTTSRALAPLARFDSSKRLVLESEVTISGSLSGIEP